jgi:hypothetical protein
MDTETLESSLPSIDDSGSAPVGPIGVLGGGGLMGRFVYVLSAATATQIFILLLSALTAVFGAPLPNVALSHPVVLVVVSAVLGGSWVAIGDFRRRLGVLHVQSMLARCRGHVVGRRFGTQDVANEVARVMRAHRNVLPSGRVLYPEFVAVHLAAGGGASTSLVCDQLTSDEIARVARNFVAARSGSSKIMATAGGST